MKEDLLKLLEYIFKSSDFSVTKSGPYDIIVEKNGYQSFVMCSLQPDYEEIKTFSRKIDENTGIYVITRKTTNELNEYANNLRIQIWDRDELSLQIGKAFLQNMEKKAGKLKESEIPGKKAGNVTVPPAGETRYRKSADKSQADFGIGLTPLEEMNSDTERSELKSTEEKEITEIGWGIKNENEDKMPENPERPSEESYEVLNIKSTEPSVSKQQAINLAKSHLGNPRDAVLKFVPFWKYEYSVEVEKRIKSKVLSIVGDGEGCFNALNKRKEEMKFEEMKNPTRVPPVVYEVKRPMVDKNEARRHLMELIIEENTREMRFNNTKGQAIIYEQRCIKPRPEDIELQIELVYVPIWEVKGKRNSLEINACTSQILEEPMDEDAEFL
ncbi:MAG: hypothetical protein PHW56_01860 [Methanosarcinaceae archaeon]|nr:hypothetical protein [Methanosarcinaceae archaeon]